MDYYIRKCLCCFGVKELLWRATNNTDYILLYLSWYPRVLFFIFLFHCSHNKNTLMLCLLASFLIMSIACSIILFLKSRYFASLHVVFTWWRHQMETFPRYWPFVRGVHRSPVNSPHKGQWRGALMLSLICTWIDGWVNTREAGDLRRHRTDNDVTVMRGSFDLVSNHTDSGGCNPLSMSKTITALVHQCCHKLTLGSCKYTKYLQEASLLDVLDIHGDGVSHAMITCLFCTI